MIVIKLKKISEFLGCNLMIVIKRKENFRIFRGIHVFLLTDNSGER